MKKVFQHKNVLPRLFLLGVLAFPLFFYKEFYASLKFYLPNNTYIRFIQGQWHLVVLNILLFLAFLIPLSFRRKARWGEYGLVTAFFVSLFIEMYGVPLSILFIYRHLDIEPIQAKVNCIVSFNMLGASTCIDYTMLFGGILMTLGTTIILVAWVTLYRNIKQEGLVTQGIYSYSRHPQYLGFILVIGGWLGGWPSTITLIFVPLLIYKYISVCRTEEKEVAAEFPEEYAAYKAKVPFFI